jgi:transposase
MTSSSNLDQMVPNQLRAFAAQLLSQVETMGKTVETTCKKIHRDRTVIEKPTHEIANSSV